MIKYYVYILLMSNKQLYTGYTTDLNRRINEHENGKVRTTSKYLPVKLIHYEYYISSNDAKRREKYLKTSKGKSTIRMMLIDTLKNI